MGILLFAFLAACLPAAVAAHNKTGTDSEVLIIFLFFGIMLGAITTHFLSRYAPNLPYTVVVFLEGIAIAALCDNVELGNFKDSVNDWGDIDAELILFLFLPVLIFGEAMSLKWHHVKGVFAQSLLLAGPGVGIGAVLMASFAKFALPYNWSWNLCMVFGSILAATDPVAVVALLKNAGASPKLTILIIGESLMNDGTAMVLFNLFFNMMKGDTYDFKGIVLYFIQMALGAPLLGVAFGVVTVWLMQRADRSMSHDDVTVQIAITFCCAYLVFFTAEYECEISGVLACVGAGLMLAWKAPPLILDPETMHHVWGMIEWIANTIIFMLAGLIIGQESLNKVNAIDWAYLLLLYIVLSLIRCVIILILYPLLSTTGLQCSRADAVFVSWAGLRGALAMSLALLVKKSDDINIAPVDSDRIFFFVGGIAAITILVNAVFASTVLDKLGLLSTEDSPDKMMVLKQVQKRLRKKSIELVKKLSQEMDIQEPSDVIAHNSLLKNYIKRTASTCGGIDVDDVHWITDKMRTVSGVRVEGFADQMSKSESASAFYNAYGFENSVKGGGLLSYDGGSGSGSNSGLPRALSRASEWILHGKRDEDALFSDLQAYIRAVFLEIVRVQYWRHIEAGKLPRESYATQSLLYSIEIALDRKHEVGICNLTLGARLGLYITFFS
jgi:NhaP-type Na+/H+ or K+/H+ antiporter